MKRIDKSCLSHKQNIAGSTPVSATRDNLCSLHETSVHETCKILIIAQREISGTPYAMLQRQLNKCNDELQIILVKKIYGVIWKHACVKTGGRGSSPLYLQYLRKLQVSYNG